MTKALQKKAQKAEWDEYLLEFNDQPPITVDACNVAEFIAEKIFDTEEATLVLKVTKKSMTPTTPAIGVICAREGSRKGAWGI